MLFSSIGRGYRRRSNSGYRSPPRPRPRCEPSDADLARANLNTKGFAHAQVATATFSIGARRPSGRCDRHASGSAFLIRSGARNPRSRRVLAPGGKLLIVDFAPHELEFLRVQEAHERLGFSHNQIIGWLKDAGLVSRAVRDLTHKSSGQDEILTVTIWLAEQPGEAPVKTSRDTAAAGTLQEAR